MIARKREGNKHGDARGIQHGKVGEEEKAKVRLQREFEGECTCCVCRRPRLDSTTAQPPVHRQAQSQSIEPGITVSDHHWVWCQNLKKKNILAPLVPQDETRSCRVQWVTNTQVLPCPNLPLCAVSSQDRRDCIRVKSLALHMAGPDSNLQH